MKSPQHGLMLMRRRPWSRSFPLRKGLCSELQYGQKRNTERGSALPGHLQPLTTTVRRLETMSSYPAWIPGHRVSIRRGQGWSMIGRWRNACLQRHRCVAASPGDMPPPVPADVEALRRMVLKCHTKAMRVHYFMVRPICRDMIREDEAETEWKLRLERSH
jgi:hypothetical protein